MLITRRRLAVALMAAASIVVPVDGQLQPGTTSRVSVASDGTQGNDSSGSPAISADGRYVAYPSLARNLVAGDTNGYSDVFVYDRATGMTTRVSVASDGTEGNGESFLPVISADGRYVAFESWATNLVPGDTNSAFDVFVHDRQTATTTRVSVASNGAQGNYASYRAAMSADGNVVAFVSGASNLVAADTNLTYDAFVHDRLTGATTRVSVATNGTQGNGSYVDPPAISADGRTVAFACDSTNLVVGDTNGVYDIFVHDRDSGVTIRASVATNGIQANDDSSEPAISADGRKIVFSSDATNLVAGDTNLRTDTFVHHRDAGTTTRVSVASNGTEGTGYSWYPSISADGGTVAFMSAASNLVAGDTNGKRDVFVHDWLTGATTLVSLASNGTMGNGDSSEPAVSTDGQTIAFASAASNFASGDTNNRADVFVHVMASTAPNAPTGLTAGASGSTITLVWSAPVGGSTPTAYAIQAGSAPNLSDLASFSTGNTATSFTANGVGPGDYYLRVRATNPAGTSLPSNEIRLVVGPPGVPSALSGGVSGSTLTLSWTGPTTGGTPTAYRIEAGSATGLLDLANFSTGSAVTSFSASGVANGLYYLRVRATNSAGTSGASNEALVVVGPSAPGAPSGLTWSAAGSSIVLGWATPTTGGPPTGYTIEAGSAPGLSDRASFSTGSPATAYSSGGIGNGTYFVRVKASNTGGASGPSNEVALVVGCAAAPGAPIDLHSKSISGGTVQFGWTAPSGAGNSNGPTTYVLEAGSAPGQSDLAVVDLGGPATTVTFGGIRAGTYHVRVKARNLCGTSVPSNAFALVVP